ncbi:hypothetical protein [Rosenbergiella nectarea]|uniref:hypothetical protein n=1 Tax=Rosenbergiella nectarea TaxID=988801 RepID=UPI001F4E5BD0|nr:hypothetical protein [Rosenbergiella nectarea]
MLKAYKIIGYTPEIDYSFIEINERLRIKHGNLLLDIKEKLSNIKISISDRKMVSINKALNFSVVFTRCKKKGKEKLQWVVRLDRSLEADVNIVVRMNSINTEPVDYFILPSVETFENEMRIKESNNINFEMYRFEGLDRFFDMLTLTFYEAS